ncbi:hypothetical protein HAT93_00882 [Dickeya solani]|nr:hypothetical protein [Dickeya solani]QKO15066.1 hypothetical protein HAT91_03476 [Dickeya solani]
MKKVTKILVATASLLASYSAMADWQPYKTVTLDGFNNTVPGGAPTMKPRLRRGFIVFVLIRLRRVLTMQQGRPGIRVQNRRR